MKKIRKITKFIKNTTLLLKCLFSAASYAALWVGISVYNTQYGIWILIIGILATLLSIYSNIILPVYKLKK